jgi:hypothetical protein
VTAALVVAAALSVAGAGETFVQAGQTAVVRVELRPSAGVLFNHRGPSRLQATGPFGPVAEQWVARGTPFAKDPDNYDVSVPPLRFEVPVPRDTASGDYSLRLTGELFLCDADKHVCFRSRVDVSTLLQVGQRGTDVPVVVEAALSRKAGRLALPE